MSDFDGILTPDLSTWDPVPQLSVEAPLLGGPGGPLNAQAQVLLDRTEILKAAVEAANSANSSTMLLSQEALIIPISAPSFPISISDTYISVIIINDFIDETTLWDINLTEVSGLTASIVDNIITVNSITATTGGVLISATRVGFPTIHRRVALSTLEFTTSPSMVMSSDSITTSASLEGVVDSFANCYTDVTIYNGLADDSANWSLSKTESNLTSTITGQRVSVNSLTADTGYVTITASRSGYPSLTKRFSLTKAKVASPKLFSIVTSANIFAIDKTGTVANPSIAISVNSANLTGSPVFSIISGTGTLVTTGNTATFAYATMVTDTVTIQATQGGFTDTVTIAKIRAGLDGANGSAGADAKTLSIVSSAQVFKVFASGYSTPGTITFSTNAQNLSGEPVYTVLSGSATLTGTGSTRTLTYANMATDVTRIQVAQDGLIDTITINKIRDGIITPTMLLSNEAVNIPCSADGTVISYDGASTYVQVYEGFYDSTVEWTLTTTDTNTTSTLVGTLLTLTELTADVGYVDVTATAAGYSPMTKRFSVTKAKTGATGPQGTNAKTLYLNASSQVFQITKLGANTPSAITFTAVGQNLTGGDPVFSITGGTLTGTGNVRTMTYGQMTDPNSATVTVTQDGLTDYITVVKVREGTDGTSGTNAIVGSLTNESVTLSADSTGTVASFALATGTFKIYNGITDATGSGTVYSVTSQTGCTGTINASTGVYSVTAMSADTGTVSLRCVYAGATIDKVFSVAKSKAGAQGGTGPTGSTGSTGAAAKSLTLTGTSQVFQVTKLGVGSPASITFTAVGQNLTGSPTFSITGGTLTGTGTTRNLTFAGMTDPVSAQITVTQDGLTDYITVAKVKEGTDGSVGQNAIVGLLTNESQTLSADNAGTVSSFALATGTFKIYNGSTDTTGTGTVYSVFAFANCTGSINASTGVYSVTAMSSDIATITLRCVYSGTTIDKVFSLAKARAGVQGSTGGTGPTGSTGSTGAAAKALTLTGTSQVFQVTKLGVGSPASITFTAVGQNLTGSPTFSITGGTLTGSGTTRNLTFAGMTDPVAAQITVTQDGLTDYITIAKVKEGTDGTSGTNAIVGMLTNESQTLSASSSGVVSSFATATGTFKIYNGSTDTTGTGTTYSVFASANCTGTINASTGVYSVSDMSADIATLTVRCVYSGTTIDKVFSLAKARAGVQGSTGGTGLTGGTGQRGSVTIAAATVGTAWSDSVANAAVVSAGYASGPVNLDIVTLYNTVAKFSEARFYASGTWAAVAAYITGNQVVQGSISADKLSVTNLSSVAATIGTLRTSSIGARMEISDNVIKVYDSAGVKRIQFGDLSL